MPRYYFVFSASEVLIDGHGSDPAIGFVALRERRGQNIEDAGRLAKIELLKHWKLTFNQDNKAGTPSLKIVHKGRIRNPIKKVRASDDFVFFRDVSQRDQIIEEAMQASRSWLAIRM